ncbi:MAG TPA: GntR family transcriptional regulator [Cellulomonas sp.]|uniref:GntR family transcriptional regulator n=1 Tax=Cellulomonas sp. TaxID=40001 RepID=UPI002E351A63|nr:GntR family transcriptional regulator [Cellulomonas sp.]HEX5334109.1 GntR family transcriptional regulator [Cellulomonas sp.]
MNDSVQLGRAPSSVQVERRVLRDGVFDRLVEMLLSDSLAPGANLNIEGLARQLGVSPTPVREALAQLEHTGLVSRVALRGYRVSAPLTLDEIGQLNDARMIVELGALDIALRRRDTLAPLLDAAQRRHLDVVAAIADSPAPEHEAERIAAYRRFYDADWAFHLTIMEHAKNRYLLQMADVLGSHIHRLRQSVELGLRDMNEATTEHGRILRALQLDDPAMTMQAMREHLAAVRSRSLADGAAEQRRHSTSENA